MTASPQKLNKKRLLGLAAISRHGWPYSFWLLFGLPVRFMARISDLAGGLFVGIMRFSTP